jgi:5-methylcytosine-specific restriction protein A
MYIPEEEEIPKEKAKARQLRASQWWKRQCAKGVCHYCGKTVAPRELTMDHVLALALGGKTTKGNVVPCWKKCNSLKKSRLPTGWDGT